jgi:hypothetical protein
MTGNRGLLLIPLCLPCGSCEYLCIVFIAFVSSASVLAPAKDFGIAAVEMRARASNHPSAEPDAAADDDDSTSSVEGKVIETRASRRPSAEPDDDDDSASSVEAEVIETRASSRPSTEPDNDGDDSASSVEGKVIETRARASSHSSKDFNSGYEPDDKQNEAGGDQLEIDWAEAGGDHDEDDKEVEVDKVGAGGGGNEDGEEVDDDDDDKAEPSNDKFAHIPNPYLRRVARNKK